MAARRTPGVARSDSEEEFDLAAALAASLSLEEPSASSASGTASSTAPPQPAEQPQQPPAQHPPTSEAEKPVREPEAEPGRSSGPTVHVYNFYIGAGSQPSPCTAGAAPAPASCEGCSAADPPADNTPAPLLGKAYAVWVHPLRPDLRGVHCGGGAAFGPLVATFPNGQYSYSSGTRFRSYPSEREAIAGYLNEAARHGAPTPPPLFGPGLQRR